MNLNRKLPTDRHSFVIVATLEDITISRMQGHLNVKVICPGCQKEMLRTSGEAEFILQYGCAQHTKTDNS